MATHQAAVGGAVEGEDGAGLERVRAHKVARVLHHIHPLGVAAVHPKPALGNAPCTQEQPCKSAGKQDRQGLLAR